MTENVARRPKLVIHANDQATPRGDSPRNGHGGGSGGPMGDLSIGDLVALRSGGPFMTVHAVTPLGCGHGAVVIADWFAEEDLCREEFLISQLVKVIQENASAD